MNSRKTALTILVCALILTLVASFSAIAQDKHGPLAQILIYKGEVAGTGTGITTFKLTVGEEISVTAKGVDKEGNDVPIWPTWKADKELSLRVIEGKSKTAVVKALKEGAPLYFTAIYIDENGKRVKGDVMGEVKEKK